MHIQTIEGSPARAVRPLSDNARYISKRALAARWECTERTIDRYREQDPEFPKLIFLGPQLGRFEINTVEAYEASKRGKRAA